MTQYKKIGVPIVLFDRFWKVAGWFGYRSFSEMCIEAIREKIDNLEVKAEDKKDAEIERRKEKTYVP